VRFISAVCEKAVGDVKTKGNLESVAVANLGVLIYRLGMAMLNSDSDGDEVNIYSFLPFPDVSDNKLRISRKGREIIRKLLQENKLGTKLIPLIAKHRN
jgi:hypothetical protein